MSRVRQVIESGLVAKNSAPAHFPDSIQYETLMGSQAYGVAETESDWDVYGWCIPPKHIIFPHLVGYIPGFGQQPEKFDQWMVHHVVDEARGVEYDFTIYNIVKYFSLVMENNPNMIDSLFTPHHSILHCSPIAQMVRDQRHIFLHKGAWHKFKGYAYSQMSKIRSKEASGKRKELVDAYGYDVKFAYHLVRLMGEVEQILVEGDLDLLRNREQLKSIRRGEWTLEEIEDYFTSKEKSLETVYLQSTLQHSPDEKRIQRLLMDCLEHHYGNLQECVVDVDKATETLKSIAATIRHAGF